MAEPRALGEWPRLPRQLGARQHQVGRHQVAHRGDDARAAVTPLQPREGVADSGRPVREPTLDARFSPQWRLEARTQLVVGEEAAQRVDVADQSVSRPEVLT